MKTRGIQNAINRLKGARRLGSSALLAQAEGGALHALAQANANANAWLERSTAGSEGEFSENHAAIAAAALDLERVLGKVIGGS